MSDVQLHEPKSHALMEYNGGLKKAILRDSELLSEVNDAFCKSHPLLAQKVVTRSARAAVSKIGADALVSKALSVRRAKAGSLLKTIREVNALKLEENDVLVGHEMVPGYHFLGMWLVWLYLGKEKKKAPGNVKHQGSRLGGRMLMSKLRAQRTVIQLSGI